jgi:KDO2-lipid IV(A) lauroyltransferase
MRRRLRHLYVYVAVRVLGGIVTSVARSTAIGIGAFAGLVIYLVIPRQSRKALENLIIAYGGSKTTGELRRMTRRVFIALGRNLADVLRIPLIERKDLSRLVSVRGLERFDRALSRGRGLIAVTGHLGCWELIPAFFSLSGYPVSVVARTVYDTKVDSIVRSFRSAKEIELVDDGNFNDAVKCLGRGRALGLLIDERAKSSGVPVDFFGGRTRVTRGPVVLSMRSRSPIVPLAIHRGDRGRHVIEVGEPIYVPRNGRLKEEILSYAKLCSRAVESYIRKYPTEWVWMHDKFEV